MNRSWLSLGLIAVVTFALYAKTLSFGFVDYDDSHLIATNQEFLRDLSNIPEVFTRDVFAVRFFQSSKSYYRPLLTLSLMFDARLGGPSPFVYHFTNIMIHIAASCALYLFLCIMRFREDLSLFFTLIFAVHPLLTQAVAWVPGRNDSLLALCVLGAMIFFIRLMESGKARYLVLHLLSLLLALFSKETALGVIGMSVLYVIIINKEKPSTANTLLTAAGWFGVVVLWFFLRSIAVVNPEITLMHSLKSIIINSPGIIQYVGKIFFPVNLSVYPIMKDMPLWYGIAALIIILLMILFSGSRDMKVILFGAAWAFSFFLPSLVSADPGGNTMFLEHRAYLPLMGIIILLMGTGIIRRIDFRRPIPRATGISIIAIFAFLAFSRSDAMKDPFSYWMNAAVTSPGSAVARVNLGDKYFSRRMLDSAEAEFRKAIELDPRQPIAHNNLGRVYAVRGKLDEAEREFIRELEINPEYENALYNLGMLSYDRRDMANAVYYWERTLRVNPYNINANRFLAYYYYQSGDLVKARHHVERLHERGVAVDKDHFRALNLP